MVKSDGFVWKCECGYISYGRNPPTQCEMCDDINSFLRVPEEEAAAEEEKFIRKRLPGDSDED